MAARARWFAVAFAVGTVACEAILVEPAVIEHDLRFSVGSLSEDALARIAPLLDRVVLSIAHGDQVWDTVLPLRNEGGQMSARMSLPPLSGSGPIVLDAELWTYYTGVFEGTIHIPAGYGIRTVTTIPMTPIVVGISIPPSVPIFTGLGQSVTLESAVVVATGDTLHGALVVWRSTDPTIVGIVDGNRAVPRSNGNARLGASYGDFVRIISATVRQEAGRLTGVAPADTVITVGDTFRLRPLGVDVTGYPLLPGTALQWNGSGPLTVDDQGWVTGYAVGSGLIYVSSGQDRHTALVSVEPR
ncbi:MAG: hypothetical protein OEZ65_15735 [Gemmatimonadota bacterium]|nr:hypothetical protein [Gemmatimonadota bacterium]